jgi:hypothetical protein
VRCPGSVGAHNFRKNLIEGITEGTTTDKSQVEGLSLGRVSTNSLAERYLLLHTAAR